MDHNHRALRSHGANGDRHTFVLGLRVPVNCLRASTMRASFYLRQGANLDRGKQELIGIYEPISAGCQKILAFKADSSLLTPAYNNMSGRLF